MSNDADSSPVKPTVIDLDPDQVTVEREAATGDTARGQPKPEEPLRTTPAATTSSSYRVLAFLAALVIGAVAGGWLYRDAISAYFPSSSMVAIGDRLNALGKGHEALTLQVQALERLSQQLTADVNALEAAAGTSASEAKALADELAAAKSSLAQLDSAVSDTKAALAGLQGQSTAVSGSGTSAAVALPPDLAQRIAALEQDVAALKAQKSGTPDKAALIQVMADLKAKIEAGTAFAAESDRLARLLPAASGLDVIAAHAAAGIPNAKGLAGELAVLKPGLPTPEIKVVPQDPGIWERIGDMLSTVITIRDLDAVNWQQVAEKAIAFAEAGDLPQAIAAVDGPEAEIPTGLQQWRDRAASRVALEAALASVSEAAARVQAAGP